MDTSAISGSAKGDGVQGAVQMNLLRKSQDLKAQEMQQTLQTIQAVSPTHLGMKMDKTA